MATPDVRTLIGMLEGEVNNGGFDQFFLNSAGDHTREILAALEEIGATHTASIVRSAARKFPGGMPPANRAERQALLLHEVSPDSTAFWVEDGEFLEYKEDLTALVNKRYAS